MCIRDSFTIQSNTILTIVAAIAGIAGFMRSGPQARWIVALRSLATVCMVIVGVVYATLLAPLGLEGGAPVPWANSVSYTHLDVYKRQPAHCSRSSLRSTK